MTLAGPPDERDAPLATVVIVNWNGAKLLPACLDAVAAQRTPFRFRTVVVDNGSSDESVALVRERYPAVLLVETGSNLGFAGGNNAALRSVTTPYVALLNNDAVPEPGWLAALLAPFCGPAGESVGAVTGKVLFLPQFLRLRLETTASTAGWGDSRPRGVCFTSVLVGSPGSPGTEQLGNMLSEGLTYGPHGPPGNRRFWSRPSGELLIPVPPGVAPGPVEVAFTWFADERKDVTVYGDGPAVTLPATIIPQQVTVRFDGARVDAINNAGGIVLRNGDGADRGYQHVDDGSFDSPEEVFAACGNGMAMRTTLGHELGWFDDSFFAYYEDTDLSWRIRSAGWSIRYEPTAVLRHLHAATSIEWSPFFSFHVERNRLLMLTKNASLPFLLRTVGRHPLTTASMTVRALLAAAAERRKPELGIVAVRARAFVAYLRLLPRTLAARRALGRTARVSRQDLELWLVDRAGADR